MLERQSKSFNDVALKQQRLQLEMKMEMELKIEEIEALASAPGLNNSSLKWTFDYICI